jgi:hypothetical protein
MWRANARKDELNDTGKHIESTRSLMAGNVKALIDSEDIVVVEAIPSHQEQQSS